MTESTEVQGPDPCAAACMSAQEHFVTSTHPVRDRYRTVNMSLTYNGYQFEQHVFNDAEMSVLYAQGLQRCNIDMTEM
jgi:hypothetical protein